MAGGSVADLVGYFFWLISVCSIHESEVEPPQKSASFNKTLPCLSVNCHAYLNFLATNAGKRIWLQHNVYV